MEKKKVFKSFSEFSLNFSQDTKGEEIKTFVPPIIKSSSAKNFSNYKKPQIRKEQSHFADKKNILANNSVKNKLLRFNYSLFNEFKDLALNAFNEEKNEIALENFSKAINLAFDYIKKTRDEGVNRKKIGDVDGAIQEYKEGKKVFKKLHTLLFYRGILRKKIKDYSGAMEDFTLILKYYPFHKKACLNKIEISKRLGNFEDVLNDFDVLTRIDPSNPVYLYQKGKILAIKGNVDEALDTYKKALSIDKKSPSYYMDEGDLLFRKGKFHNAVKFLRIGIQGVEKIFSDFSKIHKNKIDNILLTEKLNLPVFSLYFTRAKINEKLGVYEQAISDYNKALYYERNIDVLLALADILMILKKYDESLILFSEVIAKDPKNYSAFVKRGQINFEKELFDDAISDFSKALIIEPFHIPIYLKRAEAKIHTKDYQGAYLDYTKYIEFKPRDSEVYLKRAHASLKLNNIEKLSFDIKDFAKVEASIVYSLCKEASRCLKLHSYSESIKLLSECILKTKDIMINVRKYIDFSDKHFEKDKITLDGKEYNVNDLNSDKALLDLLSIPLDKYYYLRGLSYMHKGDNKEAISDFNASIDICEALNDKPLFEKCKVYIKMKEYKLVMKDLKNFIENNVRNDYAYFLRAEAYYHKSEFDSAIKDLNKAIKINPSVAHYHASLGRNFFKKKLYESAILSFKKALEKNKDDSTALKGLAIVYSEEIKEKNLIDALKYANRAIDISHDSESYQILAMIYSYLRDFEKAIENQKKAYNISNNKIDKILLERYSQNKTWTDLSV